VQKPLKKRKRLTLMLPLPLLLNFQNPQPSRVTKVPKGGDEGLLSLLAPPHIRNSENHALSQGCRGKDISTQRRPLLVVLRSLEERALKEEKRDTNTVFSSVEEIHNPLY
jgi:hypothetical protein